MLADGGGAIVNTSSAPDFRGRHSRWAIGQQACRERNDQNRRNRARPPKVFRGNAVNPGGVETPMVAHLFEQMGADNPEAAAAMMEAPDAHPIGRSAQPDEVVKRHCLLGFGRRKRRCRRCLPVDGGLTAKLG